VPLWTRNWLPFWAMSGTLIVEVKVPPLFLIVPLLVRAIVPVAPFT
jgi:hypothetical protein